MVTTSTVRGDDELYFTPTANKDLGKILLAGSLTIYIPGGSPMAHHHHRLQIAYPVDRGST